MEQFKSCLPCMRRALVAGMMSHCCDGKRYTVHGGAGGSSQVGIGRKRRAAGGFERKRLNRVINSYLWKIMAEVLDGLQGETCGRNNQRNDGPTCFNIATAISSGEDPGWSETEFIQFPSSGQFLRRSPRNDKLHVLCPFLEY